MTNSAEAGSIVKRALFVTYNFPPCSVTGTFRLLSFVRHVPLYGWQSSVLTAENPVNDERDERLLLQIPGGTEVVRTRDQDVLLRQKMLRQKLRSKESSTPTTISEESRTSRLQKIKQLLFSRLRPYNHNPAWRGTALKAGREMIRLKRPDVLFSSGPPWTTHEVALSLATEFDLPWVADFRDPWVSNPFRPEDQWLLRKDSRLERKVLERADAVICVLDTMRDDLLARYPSRTSSDVVTIMNGFDPILLESFSSSEVDHSKNKLTILHAGQIYGRRRVEPLLSALKDLMMAKPELQGTVELELLGGDSGQIAKMEEKIAVAGVSAWAKATADVPHQEALSRLSTSTVLLLVGFSGKGEEFQMSAKIFEYLAARRAILAMAPANCPVGTVLQDAGVRHWIVQPDDQAALTQALFQIADDWRAGRLNGPQSTSSLSSFNRKEQAREASLVMEDAIRRRQSREG